MGSIVFRLGGSAAALKTDTAAGSPAIACRHGDELHQVERDVFVTAGAHRKGRCFHDQNSWIRLSVASRYTGEIRYQRCLGAIIAEGSSVRAEEEYHYSDECNRKYFNNCRRSYSCGARFSAPCGLSAARNV